MSQNCDIFDHITGARDALKAIVFLSAIIWQTIPTLLGLIVYVVLVNLPKIKWLLILIVGVLLVSLSLLALRFSGVFFTHIMAHGFAVNTQVWQNIFANHFAVSLGIIFSTGLPYLLGLPCLLTALWVMFDLISNTPHEKALKSIHSAAKETYKELTLSQTNKALQALSDENYDGVLLGISKYSGNPVTLADKFINQIVLVLGTTGGGKTITLRRFYKRAAIKNYPLIIVDGKPTDESIAWVIALAAQHQRKFYGFNCDNFQHYDALAEGGYTELKDKIISLKDQWESDYYKSIAENYLQTAFEVLLKSQKPFDLKKVVECLDFGELALIARATQNDQLINRVRKLADYELKDIKGLQAHLNLLIHSELGEFFTVKEANTFSLTQIINESAIVYFALPALRYPTFSTVLGKLIINDIKAVIDRNKSDKKIFTIFDEFSVFAGDQVLNLVNMGRGKGVHAVFGTQGLADLKKVDENFANQVLNCANTIICHRLNDQASAEDIAAWVGTKDTFTLTAQVDIQNGSGGTGLGSVRRTKEFIVHPDSIKQDLAVGEAFLVSKVGRFYQDKICIKFN